jgi:isopenicillin N synthase-like dioxygenase
MIDSMRTGEETTESASIRVVKLEGVVSGDSAECQNLLSACSDDGFFYLDYAGRQEVQWKESLQLIKVFYTQNMDTKMRYWRGRNKTGYKPLGIDPGVGEATKRRL